MKYLRNGNLFFVSFRCKDNNTHFFMYKDIFSKTAFLFILIGACIVISKITLNLYIGSGFLFAFLFDCFVSFLVGLLISANSFKFRQIGCITMVASLVAPFIYVLVMLLIIGNIDAFIWLLAIGFIFGGIMVCNIID